MRALVTGATGFLGRELVAALERPVILSRRPESAKRLLGDLETFAWEPLAGPPPREALREVEVIYHLAGEPVASGRWNDKRKSLIRESRVRGTQNLVAAIESQQPGPQVLVSASAVGYYGSRGDELLEESAPAGSDFLAEVCVAWEAEAQKAAALGLRVATARIGMVLGPGGGALARMLPPFKLGLAGRLSSGQQWVPWIHIDDVVGLLRHAAERSEISGPMNAVAPTPIRNREFTSTLARLLHRPAVFPVPALALKMMFGELASVLLASQRVAPRVAEKAGYRYRYPSLEEALGACLASPHQGIG